MTHGEFPVIEKYDLKDVTVPFPSSWPVSSVQIPLTGTSSEGRDCDTNPQPPPCIPGKRGGGSERSPEDWGPADYQGVGVEGWVTRGGREKGDIVRGLIKYSR